MNSGDELERFVYFLINLFLVLLSVLLRRRVFVIFGGLGIITYLGHLSYRVFQDSLLFPIAISVVGFLIILGGIQYQKYSSTWSAWLRRSLPQFLLQLLPKDH